MLRSLQYLCSSVCGKYACISICKTICRAFKWKKWGAQEWVTRLLNNKLYSKLILKLNYEYFVIQASKNPKLFSFYHVKLRVIITLNTSSSKPIFIFQNWLQYNFSMSVHSRKIIRYLQIRGLYFCFLIYWLDLFFVEIRKTNSLQNCAENKYSN